MLKGMVSTSGGTVISSTKSTFAGVSSVEAELSIPRAPGQSKAIGLISKDRVYVLLAFGVPAADWEHFKTSFHLV